jgi:NAD(P)-dependent dehydrogenase (short-subunit alcohol dehydrogenase family)
VEHTVVALRGGRRWAQVYQPVGLGECERRPAGTILITGGLGGIGLALADRYVRDGASVALVTRSALPDPTEWPQWTADRPSADPTRARIRAVQQLRAHGAKVEVVVADVTDAMALRAAAERAADRLGPIDHIIHAAGVAGGGLIQLKDPGSAWSVLAPKVLGGRHVVDLARELAADVTLCSSLLAVTGGVGQVDYVAANAFLDALAQHAPADGPSVVSVNWDGWQEVGMAHRQVADASGTSLLGPVEHPLLDGCLEDTAAYTVHTATVSSATSWLVDEHRMLGDPVVPGTGHLELARAAFAHLVGAGPVELRDVRFYTPAVLAPDEVRELRVVLDKRGEWTRFTVVSRWGDEEGGWQAHASGHVRPGDQSGDTVHDVAALLARGHLTDRGCPEPAAAMGYGQRSRCLRRIWQGEKEALAEIELPQPYIGELDQLHLHPSILDIAAGFVGVYLAEDFRIPISYGRLSSFAPLTPRLFSHHRYREVDRAGREAVTADIILFDPAGRELVRIDDFVLKRVSSLRDTLDRARDGTPVEVARFDYPKVGPARSGLLASHVEQGIRPAEGAEAHRRIIASGIGPQMLVVSKSLDAVIADIAGAGADDGSGIRTERPERHPRPNVLTPFRAATDRLETEVAEIWQNLLGVTEVGVDDDFVELGGHSLLGLELTNQLRRRLGVEVPLAVVFAARTVAELASHLRDQPVQDATE